ncbi:MAG: ATP-dependent DNA helicase RecG, partial [Lachnospiraceae bacterium]|nr:ATP-dependent DNA helicase RecG [Lachnospiraceae bacterium]
MDGMPIKTLKGVGEKSAGLYNKLNIHTVEDLVKFYPRNYEFMPPVSKVKDATEGETGAYLLNVSQRPFLKKIKGLSIISISCFDSNADSPEEAEKISVTFFNMPYLVNSIKQGSKYVFVGVLKGKRMEHPKMYKAEDYFALEKTIQPLYPLTKGLSNNSIKKAVMNALNMVDLSADHLPLGVKEKYKLIGFNEAVNKVHFPGSEEELRNAHRRLAFEEFFYFLLLVRKNKLLIDNRKTGYQMIETSDCQRLIESLPYRLTDEQTKVWSEIKEDLSSGYLMSRMIQGDVGSGKTILAFLSLLMAVTNNMQGAMMAPTEVLAKQHFEGITELTRRYNLPFKPVLLTGSVSKKDKNLIYEMLKSGEANIAIGTHALISEGVEFRKLALVITDEQHRFGVNQREAISLKGDTPHVLVMSATPIPRSLAMILYGDLSISRIEKLPGDRIPIKNAVITTDMRPNTYRFIAKEVSMGHQGYVICPLVEASEEESAFANYENVKDYAAKLKGELPESVRIGILHGKMKADLKNKTMQDFHDGLIDVLVSTTVIEVGINVPNATFMVIENAQAFGLSTLHQLRG